MALFQLNVMREEEVLSHNTLGTKGLKCQVAVSLSGCGLDMVVMMTIYTARIYPCCNSMLTVCE